MRQSYRVVEKWTREDLEEEVTRLINDIWVPIGGVVVVRDSVNDHNTSGLVFYQAMVERG